MLARGRGFMTMEMLKSLFGLPEDAEIVRIEFVMGGVEFHVVSKEPIERKTYVVADEMMMTRRFRPEMFKETVTGGDGNKRTLPLKPEDLTEEDITFVMDAIQESYGDMNVVIHINEATDSKRIAKDIMKGLEKRGRSL